MASSSLSAPAQAPSLPLRQQPGFDAAVRNSIAGSLALLDRDPSFYRTIGDIPTYALGLLALFLHANDRLYHRGLQEAAKGLFSAGRATAILARMQRAGLIVPRDAFQSGKQRRYSPSPTMLEAFRACYLIELQSLAVIDPRAAAMVAAYDDPAVFNGIVALIASRHLAAPAVDQELIDPLGGVGRRSMGLMAAYALVEAAFKAGHPRAEGPVPVNLSRLATRLGVSRTHARRVLAVLENAGLVVHGTHQAELILTPAFAEGVDLYFIGVFGMLQAAVDAASND